MELNTAQWQRLRRLILERDGYQCQIRDPGCHQLATHVDHIVPLVEGGSMFDPANLRAACRRCNERRGAYLGNRRKRMGWVADRFAYRVPGAPAHTRF